MVVVVVVVAAVELKFTVVVIVDMNAFEVCGNTDCCCNVIDECECNAGCWSSVVNKMGILYTAVCVQRELISIA